MSLFSAAERLSSLDHSAIAFNEARCLHSKDRFSTCEQCFDICPESAIAKGKPPTFNEKDCTTCMACLQICPVGAFQGADSVKELLTCMTRLETHSVELICQENSQKDSGVRENSTGVSFKGCLAGLGAGTYLTIFSLGVEEIILRMDACHKCKWNKLIPTINEQVILAKNILSSWNKAENLILSGKLDVSHDRPCWDAHNPPLSRRDLFRLATRQGKSALAHAVENSNSDDHLPGRDRRRILNSIRQFPIPEFDSELFNRDNFADLSISDTCTACGTCARACPTRAISFLIDKDESNFELAFTPGLCVACEMCVHVCLPSSITILDSIPFAQILDQEKKRILHKGSLIKCDKCGSFFAPTSDVNLCPTCDQRRKNPFGSFVPPGLSSIAKKGEKNIC